MRVIGWLLAACVMMALLKLAAAVLAIALCILLLWGAINHPREALIILAIFAFVSVAKSSPATLIALTAMGLTAYVIGAAISSARK